MLISAQRCRPWVAAPPPAGQPAQSKLVSVESDADTRDCRKRGCASYTVPQALRLGSVGGVAAQGVRSAQRKCGSAVGADRGTHGCRCASGARAIVGRRVGRQRPQNTSRGKQAGIRGLTRRERAGGVTGRAGRLCSGRQRADTHKHKQRAQRFRHWVEGK